MQQENPELSSEAKIIILKYILSIVAIPGVLIAIFGFLIGFFIDKAATSSAYEKAFTAVQDELLASVGLASNAAANASRSAEDAQRSSDALAKRLQETEALSREVSSLQQHLDSAINKTGLVENVSKSLAENSIFMQKVAGGFGERLSIVEKSVSQFSVQSGAIRMTAERTQPLVGSSKCDIVNFDKNAFDPAYRGTIRGYQKFDRSFSIIPQVLIALSDLNVGGLLRVHVEITEVTKDGFYYNFRTFCDTKVYYALASWIAVGIQ